MRHSLPARIARALTAFVVLLVPTAVVATTASPAQATTNHAAVIGMPFSGRWAYSNTTSAACGPASNQTSHPSCHETYIAGYDWSLDAYAPAGTSVKLKVTGLNGAPSFSWGPSGSPSCGESRRINISVGGTAVGTIQVTHMSGAASTANPPTNGMSLGTVYNGTCNPGGSYGKHVHMEFSGTSDRTCYVNYSNSSHTAGMDVSEGTAIGSLGGSSTGTRQVCTNDDLTVSSTTPTGNTNVVAVKKTVAFGYQQVYTATPSGVWETWWGSSPQTTKLVNIADNNLVGMDKIELPDGTQSIYAAVPDGIVERWWRSGEGGQAKIISGLSNVKDVIADTRVDNGQLVHLLYVLTGDGPREYWWIDGDPAGIQSRQIEIVYGSQKFVRTVTATGVNQIYTSNGGWVYETTWTPGSSTAPVSTPIISISQNDIKAIDKVTASDGTEMLYTATSVGVWESKWGGSQGSLVHSFIINNLSGIVDIEKTSSGGTNQLYAATSGQVWEYWWNSTNNGSSPLFTTSGITAIDKSTYVGYQQVYTGTSAGKVWETWWGNGSLQTGDPALVILP